MSTHTSSSADEVLASTAESGPQDPLDALLGQIVGGYFVLTDGQGSVSKWSEPAELLFGRPAQEILGQSFFGTLVDEPLPPAAESWRSFRMLVIVLYSRLSCCIRICIITERSASRRICER